MNEVKGNSFTLSPQTQRNNESLQISKALPAFQYRFENTSINFLSPFNKLAPETVTNIANFLPMRDLSRFSRVCKLFYNHSQNASCWRNPSFDGDRGKADKVLNKLKEYKEKEGSYVFDKLFQHIVSKTAPRLHLPTLIATLEGLTPAQQRHFMSDPVISALDKGTLDRNQAVALARLLDQEINDRDPAHLAAIGLLNQEEIQSLSSTQQSWLLDTPVILAVVKKTLNCKQALKLARLLDQQSPNQRDPNQLIAIGLLKQEHLHLDPLAKERLNLSSLSEAKRDYLISRPVIFHLLDKTPDLGAFARIDDEYITAEEDEDGLLRAFNDGRDDVIALMLQSKLFLDIADIHGQTPLHRAVNAEGHEIGVAFLDFLITNGADVNKSDNFGKTPLHYAAQKRYIDRARRLFDAKANVNQPDSEGFTPLHWLILERTVNNALEQDIQTFVELLLQNGANVSQRDDAGMTALFSVRQSSYPQVFQTLRDWKHHSSASR